MKKILLMTFCICFFCVVANAKEWNDMTHKEQVERTSKWARTAKHVIYKNSYTMPTVEGVKKVYNLLASNCIRSAESLINQTAGAHIIKGDARAKIIRYINSDIVEIQHKDTYSMFIYGIDMSHKQYTLAQYLIPLEKYQERFMK